MPKRYFNWRLAIVLFIFLMVTVVTVIAMRQWQQNRLTYDAKQKGLIAYKQNNWELASKNLARYLSVNSNDVAMLFDYAQAQLNIRPLMPENMQNAISAYRKILRIDKTNFNASGKLVSLYLQLNVPAEAELIAQRSLREKDDPQIRSMLAIALAKQRKFDQASIELQQVIKNNPDHVLAYELLGKLAEQYPDHFPENGQFWFNEAVKNNPYSAQAFIARGAFNSKNKDLSDTIKDFEIAESLDVSDVNTHLSLASELINVEMFDKAKTHLLAVEAKDSKNQSLWQIWAQLALKMMSKKEMFNVAQNGLTQLRDAPWDFMPLAAELYINCGRFDRASQCINDLKNKNAAPDMIASLEAFLAKAKNHDYQAIILCRKAQKLGDNSTKTMQLLINACLQTGDAQTAILELRKILIDDPDQFSIHFELANLLAQTGNWSEAAQQANRAFQIEPDNLSAALLCIKTQINLIQNNSPNAAFEYNKLEKRLDILDKKTNGDLEVILLKFQLAMKQGQYAKAEAILNSLLNNYDHLIEVGIAKVDLLVAQNNINEAINKLYHLINLCPQNTAPVKYLAVLLEQYRKDECQKLLIDTFKQSQNPATKRQVGLLLAEFYYNQGRYDDAYKLLNALAVELPSDIPVKRNLLQNSLVKNDPILSQKIIGDIKSIEGEDGWQWKYEQANLWFNDPDFKTKYPQIITLLQDNLNANPPDQASRLLLAQTYEKTGQSQLALAAYRQALDISPKDIYIIVPAVAGMYKANQFEEADIILNRVAKQNLTHPEIAKLQLASYLRQGDINSAENILEDLNSHDPNNSQVSLSLALLKIRQNKFKMAQDLLDTLKKQNPDSIDISAAAIELCIAQKLNDKAISDCNELVAKFKNASSYIIRGKTYCAIGKTTRAQADFDHAVQLESQNVNTWIARSNYYQLTGYRQKAFNDMQQALKLDPENLYIIKYNIAFALYSTQSDKFAKGQKLLEKAITLSSNDIDLEIFKAQYLLSRLTPFTDQNAEAILKKITEQHPSNTDAWEILARLYLKQDQLSLAMDTALQGLAYSPDDKNLLLVKIQIEAAHSPELAIPNLKVLYDHQPDDIDIIATLAKAYISSGNSDKAVTFLKNNLDNKYSQIDRSKVCLEYAVALYKNGNKMQALQQFDSLYNTSPNLAKVCLAEAKLLIEDQQWDMLNQRITNKLPQNTDKNALLIAIADNLIAFNNDRGTKIAENLLNKIIENEPNNTDAMSSIAILSQNNFKPHAAAKYYEKIIKIEPDNVIALNNLAWIIAQRPDKLQIALDIAQKGLQKVPNYTDLLDTRGFIYYQMGQNEKAAADFSKCIEMYPKNSSSLTASHFHLAKSLIELGHNQKAIDNLQLTLNLSSKLGGLSQLEISEAEQLLNKLTETNSHAANRK